ncbi:MAG: prepilin-type N-terminal cleavage/methylation domain-containing protein [Candidatus Omnitrophica bacterium]|nr:prepilin-type N-terminal cleavage/methylation domain-containing protein [Candidatus Omnitrophota bacterium]
MGIFTRYFKVSNQGFTLLEVLVSGIILGIISFSTYTVFNNFSSSQVRSQDRIVAADAVTSQFENIKRGVESNPATFSTLTSDPNWIPINVPNYPAGHFQQRVTYTPNTPQANITQVVVELQWTDQKGATQQSSNVFSLSEPSSFVFGDIIGTVFDNTNPASPVPLQNAVVRIANAPAAAPWVVNQFVRTDPSGNYSFKNLQGRNTLPVGNGYRLRASFTGLQTLTQPQAPAAAINLPDIPDIVQDFYLVPSRATISGRLVDSSNNQGIAGRSVSLDTHTTPVDHDVLQTDAQGNFSLNISNFSTTVTQRCYTVATGSADTALVDFPSYFIQGGQGFVGNFCGQKFAKGWSSSVLGNNPAPAMSLCPAAIGNPWFGSVATEAEMDMNGDATRGICVSAGDNVNLGDITLEPIQDFSTLMITVDVAAISLPAITPNSDVLVKVQWGDGSPFAELTTPFTGASTYNLSIQVPWLDLIGVDPNYMFTQAFLNANVGACCGALGEQDIAFKSEKTAVVIDSALESVVLDIDDDPGSLCGDANGSLSNLETGAPFGSADCRVTITGQTFGVSLEAEGCNWSFHCCPTCPDNLIPEKGVALQDTYKIDFNKAAYYERSSCGICAWPHKPVEVLSIAPNTILYDGSGTIIGKQINSTPVPHNVGLYRKGYGTISGQVVDQDGNPVSFAEVSLEPYCSSGNDTHGEPIFETTADIQGFYSFGFEDLNGNGTIDLDEKVVETWPPNNNFNNLPASVKPHMVNENARHRVRATGTRGSETKSGSTGNILLNKDQDKLHVKVTITFIGEV